MKYSAFISYSYKDRHWATWLHRALESYRVPKRLCGRPGRFGPVQKKLPPVFRDRDELAASADLGKAVQDALRISTTLIVICSPRSAKSHWVNEEIRTFTALGRHSDILCLIVEGEPHADDPDQECLPRALLENDATEPLAADLREGQDGKSAARLKIISGILQLSYDELRHREGQRRQKRLVAVAAASTLGFVAMSGLTAFALHSRKQAVMERDIARQRTMTAERTVGFVKSMFEVSDPSEARGSTITARQILDRGATQIKRTLNDEPAVKAELGVTLGEVYGSIGLFRESDALLQWTMQIRHSQPDVTARQLLALGDASRRLGEYERAATQYRNALAIARRPDAVRVDLIPRMLAGLAESLSALEDYDAADRYGREALALDRRNLGSRHPDIARDLEVLGLNAYFRGDYARSRPLIERALAIRLSSEGLLSPSVSDNETTLGSIAYAQGDLAGATRYFRSRLSIDEKVLGRNHPDVAISLNNLGRVLIERRSYAQAEPLLTRAVAINLKERGVDHDDTIFAMNNLAIAEKALGQSAKARVHYEQVLLTARKSKHRMLAPILTDMARMECARGDARAGMRLLEEARPVMGTDYPSEAWRIAWIDNSMALCLEASGRRAEGLKLAQSSARIIRQRWKADTHYGFDAGQPSM